MIETLDRVAAFSDVGSSLRASKTSVTF
jgi:hypothetical protein